MATIKKVKNQIQTSKTNLQKIEDLLKLSAENMGQALPSHMNKERLNRIILSLLKMTPKLQECTPVSITAAVFQMAQLGLEPIDGQAYIIPYENSKKGLTTGQWYRVKEAQFQIGYKGYVSLFYRHQSSLALFWGIVCENDKFDFDKGRNILSHKINLKGERGEPYAYWVKARLQNGAEIFEVMSKLEIIDHAEKHSKAYNKKENKFYDNTPWLTDFNSMALKTVLIQLMKLLPKSVEIQRAIQMDETTKSRVDEDMASVPDETNWDEDNTVDVENQNINIEEKQVIPTRQPEQKIECKEDDQGRLIDPKTGKPI